MKREWRRGRGGGGRSDHQGTSRRKILLNGPYEPSVFSANSLSPANGVEGEGRREKEKREKKVRMFRLANQIGWLFDHDRLVKRA